MNDRRSGKGSGGSGADRWDDSPLKPKAGLNGAPETLFAIFCFPNHGFLTMDSTHGELHLISRSFMFRNHTGKP